MAGPNNVIRVKCDPDSFPLTADRPGAIDALPPQLRAAFQEWAAEWADTAGDPTAGKRPNAKWCAGFDDRGRRLAARLLDELGPGARVELYSETDRAFEYIEHAPPAGEGRARRR